MLANIDQSWGDYVSIFDTAIIVEFQKKLYFMLEFRKEWLFPEIKNHPKDSLFSS